MQQLINNFFWPSRCTITTVIIEDSIIAELTVYCMGDVYRLAVNAGSMSNEDAEIQAAQTALLEALSGEPNFVLVSG